MTNERPHDNSGAEVRREHKKKALFIHLFAIFALILPGALAIATTKADFIKAHARRSVNLCVSVLIYYLVIMLLMLVITSLAQMAVVSLISLALTLVLLTFFLAACLRSAIAGRRGMVYDTPLTLRFLR